MITNKHIISNNDGYDNNKKVFYKLTLQPTYGFTMTKRLNKLTFQPKKGIGEVNLLRWNFEKRKHGLPQLEGGKINSVITTVLNPNRVFTQPEFSQSSI